MQELLKEAMQHSKNKVCVVHVVYGKDGNQCVTFSKEARDTAFTVEGPYSKYIVNQLMHVPAIDGKVVQGMWKDEYTLYV